MRKISWCKKARWLIRGNGFTIKRELTTKLFSMFDRWTCQGLHQAWLQKFMEGCCLFGIKLNRELDGVKENSRDRTIQLEYLTENLREN